MMVHLLQKHVTLTLTLSFKWKQRNLTAGVRFGLRLVGFHYNW